MTFIFFFSKIDDLDALMEVIKQAAKGEAMVVYTLSMYSAL